MMSSETPPAESNRATRTPARIARPRRLKWWHHLAAALIYAAFRLIAWTWRTRFDDPNGYLKQRQSPVIYCLWHNRLALCMTMWQRLGGPNTHATGLVALISASHDGGVLARALRYFQVEAVRGSSSRRGPQALLELTSWTERGFSVAITPDGPRGPRYQIRDGIVALAQVSGLPILPISAVVRGKLTLRSWDQFQIPLPFARCEVRLGRPLPVPRDLDEAGRERLKQELQERMRAITQD
jgi:hypothetical protein